MAMNLRLRPESAAALRAEAARTGLSQQEILRRAVDEHLGLATRTTPKALPEWVIPATEPPRYVEAAIRLVDGETVLDLIDRSDRF